MLKVYSTYQSIQVQTSRPIQCLLKGDLMWQIVQLVEHVFREKTKLAKTKRATILIWMLHCLWAGVHTDLHWNEWRDLLQHSGLGILCP